MLKSIYFYPIKKSKPSLIKTSGFFLKPHYNIDAVLLNTIKLRYSRFHYMNEKQTLVSVVMPVYNAENYVKKAIISVLEQTYTNLELILINDGSTDNSFNIMKEFHKKDKRIKLISRENKGLVYSLNEGIKSALGEYIVRMDADDVCILNRIEKQVNFMKNHKEVGVSGGWVQFFGKNIKPDVWKLPLTSEELKVRLLFSVPLAHPSVIIRKKLLLENKLFYDEEYKHAEDYELWSRIVDHTNLANLPEVILNYRLSNTSVTYLAENAKDDERYQTIKKIFSKTLKKLEIENDDELNKVHYILCSDDRIKSHNLDFKVIHFYFLKIIEANKSKKIYEERALENFLSGIYFKAFILNFPCHRKKALISTISPFFYKGLFFLILKKINLNWFKF